MRWWRRRRNSSSRLFYADFDTEPIILRGLRLPISSLYGIILRSTSGRTPGFLCTICLQRNLFHCAEDGSGRFQSAAPAQQEARQHKAEKQTKDVWKVRLLRDLHPADGGVENAEDRRAQPRCEELPRERSFSRSGEEGRSCTLQAKLYPAGEAAPLVEGEAAPHRRSCALQAKLHPAGEIAPRRRSYAPRRRRSCTP